MRIATTVSNDCRVALLAATSLAARSWVALFAPKVAVCASDKVALVRSPVAEQSRSIASTPGLIAAVVASAAAPRLAFRLRTAGFSPIAASASVATPIARSITSGRTGASQGRIPAIIARSRSATNDRTNAQTARAPVAVTAARYTPPEAVALARTAKPWTDNRSAVGGTAATPTAGGLSARPSAPRFSASRRTISGTRPRHLRSARGPTCWPLAGCWDMRTPM